MKVIGINGSMRAEGNTKIIMQMVLDEIEKKEIMTEIIPLADKEIKFCTGCFGCKGLGQCVIRDDDFNSCFTAMVAAEGSLLGSPVYSADVSGKMKAFLERAGVIVATNPGLLKYKVGASVVAVRRGGGLAAVDTLNHFFLNKEVVIAGSTYWNMVYGRDVGDVSHDEEGVRNMHNLGENIAFLINKIYL